MSHVRRSPFPVQATVLTRDTIPDSRLIEIARVAKYPHQRPLEEDVTEGAVDEPDAGAGTTTHGHPGSLSFVQESELDTEIVAPTVGDIPPADAPAPYEAEPEPEHKPVEVTESVGIFIPSTRQLC